MKPRSWLLIGSVILSACGGSTAPVSPNTQHASAALVPLSGCDAIDNSVRQAALREMNRLLDKNLELWLSQPGGGCYNEEDGAGPPTAGSAGSGGGDDGASQVSGTNNQVAGVDEADFIKNDNKYIYVLGGGKLRIIDAWPADQAHQVGQIAVEGTPVSLYVSSQKALVYSSLGSSSQPYPGSYSSGTCTYGYDCDFTGNGQPTLVSVFDLSDVTSPQLVRTLRLSGSYINSRRIGDSVHTVVLDPGAQFPGLAYTPPELSSCDPNVSAVEIMAAFATLRTKNTQIILSTPLNSSYPSIVDTRFVSGVGAPGPNVLEGCPNFYDSPLHDSNGFLTVLSVSLVDPGASSTNTILSRAGAVYASPEALYLSVRQDSQYTDGWYYGMDGTSQASTVHKFALQNSPPSAHYSASGLVPGFVLNQFSMDEYQGNLRIATTSGHVPDPSVHSTLTVLGPQGSELISLGQIDNIAPGEDIRSARFEGSRGFVVTFKKTDPLYAFDLSDPNHPQTLGELQIPGFSTYMHMMDETHLLTIGYDANDHGDFAYFDGVLLQIFDVSQPAQPTLAHREKIGTRGSSSEALTNHLAFNYFAPKNVLCLPMTICEGGGDGTFGTDMTFSGLMVYDVTVGQGFHLKGEVAHPQTASGGYNDAACSNWWSEASSEVKRSIIMDDFVYSVSEKRIKVNALSDLGTDLVTLPLDN